MRSHVGGDRSEPEPRRVESLPGTEDQYPRIHGRLDQLLNDPARPYFLTDLEAGRCGLCLSRRLLDEFRGHRTRPSERLVGEIVTDHLRESRRIDDVDDAQGQCAHRRLPRSPLDGDVVGCRTVHADENDWPRDVHAESSGSRSGGSVAGYRPVNKIEENATTDTTKNPSHTG